MAASQKLAGRYTEYLKLRVLPAATPPPTTTSSLIEDVTTDDERIVLYYIISKRVRKVSGRAIRDWLIENEIHNVNIDNAFDLLSSIGAGAVLNDTLEVDIGLFRKYTAQTNEFLPELCECVEQHRILASDLFMAAWNSQEIDSVVKLFVAYIVEEKVCSFGDRWMASNQIGYISEWENKNYLDFTLSQNYGNCLESFVQNGYVYASGWTRDGNVREYRLYSSLQKLLFNCSEIILNELESVKQKFVLPF